MSTKHKQKEGTMATEMLTPHQIEEAIGNLCLELETETYEYASLSDSEANAEADYKKLYATTMLELIGSPEFKSAPMREAYVDDNCSHKYRALKIAQARRQSSREALLSLRSRLDAFRTLSATLRSQT